MSDPRHNECCWGTQGSHRLSGSGVPSKSNMKKYYYQPMLV
jgi:hypothetical protein